MTRNSTLKQSKAVQPYTPVSPSSALDACTVSLNLDRLSAVPGRASATAAAPLLARDSLGAFYEAQMFCLEGFYKLLKAQARILSAFAYGDEPRVVFVAGSSPLSVCEPEVVEVGRRQCNRLIHMMLSKIVRLSCKPLLMSVHCCLHCWHEGSIA